MNQFRKVLLGFLLVILWMPVGAEGISIEELDHLNQEGKDDYYIDNYPTALKKWQTALDKVRFAYKHGISKFLTNQGMMYQNLGDYQKALDYYQQALTIDRKIGDKGGEGADLMNIGVVYDNMGYYQKALDYYQQALTIDREIGYKRGEVDGLTNIGVVYGKMGYYQKALDYNQQALTIQSEIGYKRGEVANLSNLGLVYYSLGDYQKALDYNQQALTIHSEIGGDKRGVAINLANQGVMYLNLGYYQKALEYLQQALKIQRKIGNKPGVTKNLGNLSLVYYRLGYYQKALDYSQQSLKILRREIGDKRDIGKNLGNLGVVYQNLGYYQKALEYLQQALTIDRKIGDKPGESADLSNLGTVYYYLGEYQKALDYYQQALKIRREIGDKPGESADLNNLGAMYVKMGYYQKALEYFQQALALSREIGHNRKEGSNLSNLGVVYYYLGDYQKALDYYQQALKIRREIGDKPGVGNSFSNLGVVYYYLGYYQKANTYFQDSVAIFEKIGSDGLWLAQRGLAFTEAKLNQFDAAIQYYEQALNNLEKLRYRLKDKEQKLSFMRNKIGVYNEFIALLQFLDKTQPKKGYDRKAIEIFERKQGRIFLEEMGQSGARLFAGFPQEILQGESNLENQLAKIRKNLVDERSKPGAGLKGEVVQNRQLIKNLEQHEQRLQTELEKLQQTIKTKYPDYYALKYPKPVKLDTLQKKVLQSDELMLVYGVMENSTTLWVIGKNTFEMFNLPLSESKLKEKISQLRDWMGTGDKTRGLKVTDRKYGEIKVKLNQASNELYVQLIPEKVRSFLTKERTVYVIPTGPLYALPFETLVTKTSKDFKEAHYLIEDVPIAYLSSASLLKILRDAQKRRQNTAKYPLLAFANPIYEGTPTSSSTQRGIIDKLRNETYRNFKNGFAPLPETENEAKEIAKILNAPTDSNPLQLGEAASVPTVNKFNEQTRLDDYQYVLFSTHGILPGEIDRINQPALVLSYPDKWGYLKMADVFGLKLNAKLVALSACNTGNGKNEKGEGVMGLTRAFMYAGTPAIAVTLWSVESLSAKILNVGFFKQLKNIQKPAAALRAIKLRMLRGDEGEKYKRPYYWAPFVVFGDAK